MKSKKEELQAELARLNALRKQVKEKLRALPVLEVGKWYLIDCEVYYSLTSRNAIVFDNGEDYSYGFNFEGKFTNEFNLSNCRKDIIREATPQEVKKALIEEAKRRYKVGNVVKCFDGVESEVNGTDFVFNNNSLFSNGERVNGGDWFNTSAKVFENGKWATIIEQDKFAELKEAHRNGAVIQFFSSFGVWENCNPSWYDKYEYRIKPEEKPKIGDVVKAWNNESSAYTVGKVIEINSMGYFLQDDLWWDNAKTITQQEAIDLLFNKGAN